MRNQLVYLFVFALVLSACKPEGGIEASTTAYLFISPTLFGKAKSLDPNNPLTLEGVDLGRHLFYDPLLSINNSISCSSCHIQQFGFSDTARFSKGFMGDRTDRHSMAIANTAWQSSFFWDGTSQTLEAQALFPIQHPKEMGMTLSELVGRLKASEMYVQKFNKAFPNQEISSENVAKALAQFEQTLVSGNSRYDQYRLGKLTASEQEIRGEQLFYTHPEPSAGIRGGNCGDCHSGTLTFSNSFSNNGLDYSHQDIGREKATKNASDKGKFKIPSLRNIQVTAPYMHDGRFNSLSEVMDHYNEHIQQSTTLDVLITNASNNAPPLNNSLGLTAQEKADIVAFLKMLTDRQFLENKAHSNPFLK